MRSLHWMVSSWVPYLQSGVGILITCSTLSKANTRDEHANIKSMPTSQQKRGDLVLETCGANVRRGTLKHVAARARGIPTLGDDDMPKVYKRLMETRPMNC
ncbi:hypothetical protein M011DRAFT_467587 [Sporormia fimetaria CBS 119925]|uniref:Uncharacterized protein n=1 Tax=Sporormia fimetaria CBS 119925 TaxID=1340428 RepID=A0A6A6VBL9_9PLEO|nr:hypothetical protein M011DRAFT_467587 [Sporormia fimetaria CBS 119925]